LLAVNVDKRIPCVIFLEAVL